MRSFVLRWIVAGAAIVAMFQALFRRRKRVVGIGSRQKETAFIARHAAFFERLPSLLKAEDVVFNRTITSSDPADPIIFYLGIRAVDDFLAVMQLAAFGFGLSAMALVRGMFERVVTAAFLHEHPPDVTRFRDFDFVQRRRAAQNVKNTIGVAPEDQQAMNELEREYQRVKPQFEVTDCKTCGTKRVSVGWHTLDVVAMAYKFPRLKDLIVPAYYVPLGQAHATMRSISKYVREVNGRLIFQRDRSAEADEMFKLAHLLLMHAFAVQSAHFKRRRIRKAVENVANDYLAIWV